MQGNFYKRSKDQFDNIVKRKLIRLGCFSFLIIQGCNTDNIDSDMDVLLHSVSRNMIKEHIAYLADDNLEGRLAGSRGYMVAANYVIEQFISIGLKPAGDSGTYLQKVRLRTGKIDEGLSFLNIFNGEDSTDLSMGEDYIFIPDLRNQNSKISAEAIFIDYGIDASKWNLDHNDYQEKNVEGKIVVMDIGTPNTFSSNEHAFFSDYGNKFSFAADRGAVGIIFIAPDSDYRWIADHYMDRGNTGIIIPNGEAFGGRVFDSSLKFAAIANWRTAEKIFSTGKAKIWNQDSLSRPHIEVKTATTYTEFSCNNIIGKVEGGDPFLKDEFIIHTAHLDHLGIGEPIDGDSIYNGAHDNASGVAISLEVARLYTKLTEKPKRTVLFAMLTAEELGFLGSDYFARSPTVEIKNIVAAINTDMPTLIAPLLSVEPIGADHSSLMYNVKTATDHLGLEIMPDHMPDEARFIRSDQYTFIKNGIPAVHLKYGLKTADPLTDLSSKIDQFWIDSYHLPSDELDDSFDFKAAVVFARLNFLLGYSVSQSPDRPAWNPGDFFGMQ